MTEPKRYLVTAALPYANGPKHIGHLAGAYIPSDVYVRYLRSQGRDVVFVCGSDEHGTAIPNQALKENTTPKAIIDKYDAQIRDCFFKLGMSFDIYHRTSEPIHHQTSQEIFKTLYDKGLLTEEISEQYFDVTAKLFLADRYIMGTCPKCGNPNAYGDQCEKCGSTLSPRELINPRSTLSGNPPVLKATKHWYLPLQHYETWLSDWILKSHKDDWKVNVYGQCKSWIDAGLQPRAMTRDLDWGIKVPLPDAEGKVLYVWFDAPIGYISATRALFQEITTNKTKFATPQRNFEGATADDWKKYWQDKDTKLLHFVGKDNIVFHCIIFPIMLHATGEYILPDNVPANEFMNLEGDKMSTSRGWSIEMHEYLADFPDKPDVLRYALLTNLPETKDSEFTWKDFQAKNNNELVAIFGNFVNRALVLTQKYFDNKVPALGEQSETDSKVLAELKEFPSRIGQSLESYRFREATAGLMDLARLGNKYLAETEPWKLAKTDMARVGTILNVALQIAANLSIVAEPFLPFSATKLREMLQQPAGNWAQAGDSNLLAVGHSLGAPALLFEKIEDEVINAQIKKLNDNKKAMELASQPALTASLGQVSKEASARSLTEASGPVLTNASGPGMTEASGQAQPAKPEISFDDFQKMDIRVGTILQAERVEKSKKLLKLQVDTGIDTRTVMSGIAEHFSPEDVIGKQVTILVNLAPRKIMGVESQGMILMATDKDGKLRLLQPNESVSPGSTVN